MSWPRAVECACVDEINMGAELVGRMRCDLLGIWRRGRRDAGAGSRASECKRAGSSAERGCSSDDGGVRGCMRGRRGRGVEGFNASSLAVQSRVRGWPRTRRHAQAQASGTETERQRAGSPRKSSMSVLARDPRTPTQRVAGSGAPRTGVFSALCNQTAGSASLPESAIRNPQAAVASLGDVTCVCMPRDTTTAHRRHHSLLSFSLVAAPAECTVGTM